MATSCANTSSRNFRYNTAISPSSSLQKTLVEDKVRGLEYGAPTLHIEKPSEHLKAQIDVADLETANASVARCSPPIGADTGIA